MTGTPATMTSRPTVRPSAPVVESCECGGRAEGLTCHPACPSCSPAFQPQGNPAHQREDRAEFFMD